MRATQLVRLSAGKKQSDATDLFKICPSAACCSIEASCLPPLTLSLASWWFVLVRIQLSFTTWSTLQSFESNLAACPGQGPPEAATEALSAPC